MMIWRTAPRNGGNPIVEYVFLGIATALSYRPLSQQTTAPVQARWAGSGGRRRPLSAPRKSCCPSTLESWLSQPCLPVASVPNRELRSRATRPHRRSPARPPAHPKPASNRSLALSSQVAHVAVEQEPMPKKPASTHSVVRR